MRLLLVEDDAVLAQALSNDLAAQHYAIDCVTDGETGWNFAQAIAYDLIVLDVNLPKLNGLQLCQRLRRSGYQQPILLLTAQSSHTAKVTGLDAGADDYVVKPCTSEELSARIRALLRRQQNAATPVLEWAALCLDPSSRRVTYQGKLVSLTAKEYSLLELFLRYPQHVFSSSQILERLWDFADSPGDETVRTLIKRLRRRLKAVGIDAAIETLYGQGYRLKSPPETQLAEQQTSSNKGTFPPAIAALDGAEAALESQPLSQPAKAAPSPVQEMAFAAWSQFKEPMLERLSLIDRAVSLLQTGNLPPECREQAEQAAHKLAGSLGMFGFPVGSQLSREIENWLQADPPSSDIAQFKGLVDQLHHRLQGPPEELNSSDFADFILLDAPANPSSLLLVSTDNALLDQLQIAANPAEIAVTNASTIMDALEILFDETPDLVLVDLTVADAFQDNLKLLEAIASQFPTLPVLGLIAQMSLPDRLKISRCSRCRLLEKSVAIPDLLANVQELLTAHRFAKTRILALNNDPLIVQSLQRLLTRWRAQLFTLANPNSFWDQLHAIAPDVLILDVELPEISGIDLCRIVRSDRRWDHLPILFLTDHQDATTIQQILGAGADDYLAKPWSEVEFISRLGNRLSRNRLSHSRL
ncbi:MAG TPA: response regulator [Leptolyngbyaceae cyanobacterium M33_DOE_097]|uniref:Response regulator n=1 Tax=Oscillatoriales cyanobacterium SpSt-418 TaxID=2282169 RepID=A0A7C3PCS4_9CYAN|nr:response regulator [Leptolyngbyaceae cyanobacterium M33_DOE_097]